MKCKLKECSVEIAICSDVWEVSVVSANSPDLMVEGTFRRGACWVGHRKIALSADLTDKTAPNVIRHELAHAVIASTQLSCSETYDEEALCEFAALYAPAIVSTTGYLMKKFLQEVADEDV